MLLIQWKIPHDKLGFSKGYVLILNPTNLAYVKNNLINRIQSDC